MQLTQAMQPTATSTMNKKQAAEFLGRSERSINEYVRKGQLPAHSVHGRHGLELSFELSDLERLKADMQTPVPHAVQLPAQQSSIATVPPIARAAARRAESTAVAIRDASVDRLVTALTERPDPITDLAAKLILNVDDARRLTGIPRDHILAALKSGVLQGRFNTIGRGWRIKRTDLNTWIEVL